MFSKTKKGLQMWQRNFDAWQINVLRPTVSLLRRQQAVRRM
jgi:hypothetical protein